MRKITKQQQQISKAKESVVRTAKAWINCVDDGTIPALHRLTKATIRLERAVTRLERLEP